MVSFLSQKLEKLIFQKIHIWYFLALNCNRHHWLCYLISCCGCRDGKESSIQSTMWCTHCKHCYSKLTGQSLSSTQSKDSWRPKRCIPVSFLLIQFSCNYLEQWEANCHSGNKDTCTKVLREKFCVGSVLFHNFCALMISGFTLVGATFSCFLFLSTSLPYLYSSIPLAGKWGSFYLRFSDWYSLTRGEYLATSLITNLILADKNKITLYLH